MLLTRYIRKCPYCGSSNIVVDYSRGVVVCRNCGTVIDDTVYDYTTASTQVYKGSKTSVERRYTITEIELINFNFNKLVISTRLSKKLRETNPYYLTKLTSILIHENELLNNECLISLVRRLSSNLKVVAIEIAKSIKQGEYPLISYYSREYSIPRNKVKRIVRNVLKCVD